MCRNLPRSFARIGSHRFSMAAPRFGEGQRDLPETGRHARPESRTLVFKPISKSRGLVDGELSLLSTLPDLAVWG